MSETRNPQQQRAIDKKNRIITAGYQLFADKGYFNTNTAEIAKLAGVSTGIVYGYFHDKRDILIEVLDIYIEHVYQPILDILDKVTAPIDFGTLIPMLMDAAVQTHQNNAAIHEALHSLTHVDASVADKFMLLEDDITRRIAALLSRAGYQDDFVMEKVHLAMENVQSYAHECVYDKHNYIRYDVMRQLQIDALLRLFSQS